MKRVAVIVALTLAVASLTACTRSIDALWNDNAASASDAPATQEPTTEPSHEPEPSVDPLPTLDPTQVPSSGGNWDLAKQGYLTSCSSAATAGSGLDAAKVDAYCECSFDALKNAYTFEEFMDLDRRALKDPEAIADEMAPVIQGCVDKLF